MKTILTFLQVALVAFFTTTAQGAAISVASSYTKFSGDVFTIPVYVTGGESSPAADLWVQTNGAGIVQDIVMTDVGMVFEGGYYKEDLSNLGGANANGFVATYSGLFPPTTPTTESLSGLLGNVIVDLAGVATGSYVLTFSGSEYLSPDGYTPIAFAPIGSTTITVQEIPEPAVLAHFLALAGAGGAIACVRLRKRRTGLNSN